MQRQSGTLLPTTSRDGAARCVDHAAEDILPPSLGGFLFASLQVVVNGADCSTGVAGERLVWQADVCAASV